MVCHMQMVLLVLWVCEMLCWSLHIFEKLLSTAETAAEQATQGAVSETSERVWRCWFCWKVWTMMLNEFSPRICVCVCVCVVGVVMPKCEVALALLWEFGVCKLFWHPTTGFTVQTFYCECVCVCVCIGRCGLWPVFLQPVSVTPDVFSLTLPYCINVDGSGPVLHTHTQGQIWMFLNLTP